MLKKVEGIIFSETDYKESSKIVNILTPNDGIMTLNARGCKRVKNKLSGIVSKLTYGYFHINYHENGMSTLIEIDVLDSFKNIRFDINLMSYSLYLLELATNVYKHEENNDIYDILISCLKKINEGYDYKIITIIMELKMLDYLGISPSFNKCSNCGNTSDIVALSSSTGGLICKNCQTNVVDKIGDIKTIKLIPLLYYIDIDKISKIDVSEITRKYINLFLRDYYNRYSGLYLKSRNFLIKLEDM